MIRVGAYEARTHLSSLLRQVQWGEHVVVTTHNVPVGRLVPVDSAPGQDAMDTVERTRQLCVGKRLHGLRFKELVTDGRR